MRAGTHECGGPARDARGANMKNAHAARQRQRGAAALAPATTKLTMLLLRGAALVAFSASLLPSPAAAVSADPKTWHCPGWAPGKLCPGWTDTGQYRCDPFGGERGVCVNGWSKDAIGWWGGGFPNSTCGGTCGDKAPFKCATDWDCSLAGTCSAGQCKCDPWTTGHDCSYLNFKKIDKSSGLGYIDPTWSSWGGNAVMGKDGLYHLFMAEIGPSGRKGLGGWQGASQIAHAVSARPDGPYTRKGLVAGPEHHNPTLQVRSLCNNYARNICM